MLVQLSGVPGSGKSTLARSVAVASDIVVLDTDVLKSSIIGSGVPVEAAGPKARAAAGEGNGELSESERAEKLRRCGAFAGATKYDATWRATVIHECRYGRTRLPDLRAGTGGSKQDDSRGHI